MTVLAATAWPTNADMIVDLVRLGYLRENDRVIDLTYGRGKWWDKHLPSDMTALIHYPERERRDSPRDGVTYIFDSDYTNLVNIVDNSYDVVAFDPPYVSMGGRSTTGLPDFADRYGLTHAANNPADLHEYNLRGLHEAARIARQNGYILVKCAPYISSGRRQDGDYWMRRDGEQMGLTLVDMLIHVGTIRPQPPGRRQVHARNNYSVLLVFKKPPYYDHPANQQKGTS